MITLSRMPKKNLRIFEELALTKLEVQSFVSLFPFDGPFLCAATKIYYFDNDKTKPIPMIMAEFLFFPTDWSFLQCLMDFEAYRVIRNNVRIRFPGFAPYMGRKEVFTEELTGPRMTNEVLAGLTGKN